MSRRAQTPLFRGRTLWIASVLFGCLAPRIARAQDPIEIVWNAPPECPDRDAVRQGVLRLAGEAAGPHARAEAVVVREALDRWRVDIQLTGDVQGSRTLSAESCDAAARAAALVIAIAVNPAAASRISEQLREEPGPPPEPTAPPPPRAPEPRDEPHMLIGEVGRPDIRRGQLDLHAFIGAMAEGAAMPRVTPGGLAGFGLTTRVIRAELEASWFPPLEVDAEQEPALGGRFAVMMATLRGCARVLDYAVALAVCGEARLQLLTAEALGATENNVRDVPLGSAGAALEATWPGHSVLSLQARAGVAVPFIRPRFVITSYDGSFDEVYQPSVIGGVFAMALVVTPAEWVRGRNARR